MQVAAKGDVSRVKELLDAGASVNDKEAAGRTPLMKATANGHAYLALGGKQKAEADFKNWLLVIVRNASNNAPVSTCQPAAIIRKPESKENLLTLVQECLVFEEFLIPARPMVVLVSSI